MKRRNFYGLVQDWSAQSGRYLPWSSKDMATASSEFEITKTEGEWRKVLTPEQFYVLRKHGTERPHTSQLISSMPRALMCWCDLPLFF